METVNKQHFVPRVYLKAWKTTVQSQKEPDKPFSGVYVFQSNQQMGNGSNLKSIMWKKRLYAINFDQLFIMQDCPSVYTDFVNQIYELMKNRSPSPVYGKLGYSVIKSKESIRKHLTQIDNWQFYYSNGESARERGILNDIHGLHSYILEDGFAAYFETNWEKILHAFIDAVENPTNRIGISGLWNIPFETIDPILSFLFMLICRNPNFDCMGIYKWIHELVFLPEFDEFSEFFINGMWYNELYRMIYRKSGGFFHTWIKKIMQLCQITLYRVHDCANCFVTSDNPAFLNRTVFPATHNMTGFVFPLTPNYLVFVHAGAGNYNNVECRLADSPTVKYFNNTIYRNKTDMIIASKNNLSLIL